MAEEKVQLPVDGIAPPAPVTPASNPTAPPASGRGRGPFLLLMTLIVVEVAYILFGIVAMAMLPQPDGSLQALQKIFTLIFAGGGALWFLFGLVGFLRISAVKDRPRMRVVAFFRLGLFVVPPLLCSAIAALVINLSPSLSLQVVYPATVEELMAPLSVTFGMPVAQKFFVQKGFVPLKYEWDFTGDGVSDQETFEPLATYIFSKSGVFTIVSTVTMTSGEQKRVSLRFVIPKVSFGVQPLSPVIDEPVTFSLEHLFPKNAGNQVPTLTKASWDFDGDGTVDLDTDKLTAVTTYHTLGGVKVAVAITLSNQTQTSLQRSLTVVVPQKQPFPITLETEPATLLGPPPFGVLFTLKTKEPIANATWDFGNQKTAEGLRVAQVFSAVGAYTVTATVRSESGSVARLSKVIRVTSPLQIPDLTFQGSPPVQNFSVSGQVPLTLDLTPSTSQPLISFSWDAPGASESKTSDAALHAVYRDSGKFFVDLIGIDPDQNVFRRRITVNAQPAESFVSFSMDPAQPTAPAVVSFDGSDTFVPRGEITGFEWDFGDNSASDQRKFSGARVEHLFQKPGTYVITLRVRTTAGESFESKNTLVVRAPEQAACFLLSRRSGKAPLGVRFDTSCSTGDFISWAWNFGDDSQSDERSPTHVYLKPGEYTVTLTATTKGGLTSVKTATISATE